MSDAKPKRAPRESLRGKAAASAAGPAEPVEIATGFSPETATAPVALATAAAEPVAEAVIEAAAAPVEEAAAASTQAAATSTQAAAETNSAIEGLWADPWSAVTEAQSALARGFEAAATEVSGLTRAGIATTTEAATAMLGAKTLAEAIEINAGYARRGFDAMLGGAAKLSEIGVKAATDASRPILDRIGESWKGLGGH
jgi:phasin family protein